MPKGVPIHIAANETLPRLWCARLLCHISKSIPELSEDRLAACPAIELFDDFEELVDELGPARALKKALRASEKITKTSACRSSVERRVWQLGNEIGLSEVESKVLVFVNLYSSNDELSSTLTEAWVQFLDPMPIEDLLSIILDEESSEVGEALSPRGFLRRSGLLSPGRDRYQRDDAPAQFSVLELGAAFEELFDHDFERRPRASQPLMQENSSPEAFHHSSDPVGSDLQMVKDFISTGGSPSQILLWGEPLVLREFSEAVAAQCDRTLILTNPMAQDGSLRDFEEALTAIQYAEAVVSRRSTPSLLVADLCNVGFREETVLAAFVAGHSAVPTLWLTNNPEDLSSESFACFDLTVKVNAGEDKQTEKLLADLLPDAVGKLKGAALEPAHSRSLVHAVARYREESGSNEQAVRELFDRALGHAQQLQETSSRGGYCPSAARARRKQCQAQYDPTLINADVDLGRILESAGQHKDLRILLHGPPGTGKSEFAKQLSVRSGRELVVERASGLLGPYVGETERNIQQAFENAEDKVLLIDEIDGLLFCRDAARRHHERSQVSEILTSLEDFRGIFVATTNDRSCLDGAAERRFDVKAKFDFLTLEQKVRCAVTTLAKCPDKEREGLRPELVETLGTLPLTPDDFGRARRNARVLGSEITPSFLLGFLEKEASGRTVGSPHRGIGFTVKI